MQAMIQVCKVYPQLELKKFVDDRDSCSVKESRSPAV